MTLIVEDGTGKADAEAYRSITDHRAYCAGRGIDLADLTDTDLEQDARKAIDFMTQQFGMRWPGERSTEAQALDWPRRYVPNKRRSSSGAIDYPADHIPRELGDAQSEMMVRIRTGGGDLSPDLTRAIITETIGPITTTYDKNSPEARRYRAVEMMLRPFLKNGGSMAAVGLVRC